MPNNINVTVELSAEDRARLDKIIDSLSELFITEAVEPVDVLNEEPMPEPEPTVTLDEVRLLVQKLATPSSGKRDAVRAVVMKYAKSVSDIPADKLDEVYAELTKIKEG